MIDDPDSERLVGVEIEFAGIDTLTAGRVLTETLGGVLVPESAHRARLTNSSLGDVEIELDTRYAHADADDPGMVEMALDKLGARESALGLLSTVVPVEIVTEPLTRDKFAELDRAVEALRAAGAVGTADAAVYAFGVHLNIALTHGGAERAIRIAAAYAFAERWIRERNPVDGSRRVVPFIDPYPKGFRADLAEAMAHSRVPEPEAFIWLYQHYNPNRNRGLDLWPLLGHLSPKVAETAHGSPVKNPRPAFHYRWPDSRVGEPGWSPWTDLDHWIQVERAADDPPRLERLRDASSAVETGKGMLSDYMKTLDEVMA